MTTAIAPRTGLPGELFDNGYVPPPDLTFDEWRSVVALAERIVDASPWWLADAIEYGRQRFGEAHTQAFPTAEEDPDGASQSRLKQAAWMADRWPRGTRVPGQSYSAHRAVAKLDRPEAVALLHETDREGRRLTVRALTRRADEIAESTRGRVVDATGTPVETPDLWAPDISELTEDARFLLESRAPANGRHRAVYVAAWLACLVATDQQDAFVVWRGP